MQKIRSSKIMKLALQESPENQNFKNKGKANFL